MNRLFFLQMTGSRQIGILLFSLSLLFLYSPSGMNGQGPYQSWPAFPPASLFPYLGGMGTPNWPPSLHIYEAGNDFSPNIGMHWKNFSQILSGVTQWGITTLPGTYSSFATTGDVVLNASEGEDLIFSNLSGSKYSGVDDKGAIRFGTAQADGSGAIPADVERMTILHNGNVGIRQSQPTAKFQVTNGSVLFDGSSGSFIPIEGAGTRLMWYGWSRALRAGFVEGDQWDSINIGFASFAVGHDTKASAGYSAAMGIETSAEGSASMAINIGTVASGSYSFAGNAWNEAVGDISTVFGLQNKAQSFNSFVVGRFNIEDPSYNSSSWIETDPLFVVGNGAYEANSNALTILKNGDVGIGDHQPAGTRLLVKSSGNTDATTALDVRNSSDAPLLFIQDDGMIGIGTDVLAAFTSVKSSGNTNSTTALDVRNSDDNSLLFVRDDGKIGVGTSTPDALLSVKSTAGSPSGSVSLFRVDNATATEPLLVVREDGFVGIGTEPCSTDVSSGILFKVNGAMKSKEIIVETTNWCDFVFEDGYELMPLDLLEEKIEELGHLPGIPSTTEVTANGVNVGTMQAKLLQKVEELTLYVINLKKENEALTERLKKLEEK